MAEAMSAEELEALGKTLAEMGLKPKADNPQAFKEWMEQYVESVHSLPKWETKSAASSYIPPVKISYFSGDSSAKGHVDFDVWLYEVECLMKSESVSPDAINQVVRHSLKGDAARVAMRLGPAANVYQLIDKLKSVFGVVASSETLMAQFYNSRQGECESVSAWSRRLDNIIGQALTQGEVHSSDIDRMLRSRFWHGLRRDLKDCSGYILPPLNKMKSLRKRLEDSYRIASEAADHSRAQQKKLYDSRIRGAMIQVGDRVLVRALAFDGKHKLADRWEEDVYIVHSQPNAHVPVFMVEKEKGHGKARTLHRNLYQT